VLFQFYFSTYQLQLSFFRCIFSSLHSYFTPLHRQENVTICEQHLSTIHAKQVTLSQWCANSALSGWPTVVTNSLYLPFHAPIPPVADFCCSAKCIQGKFHTFMILGNLQGCTNMNKKSSQLVCNCRQQMTGSLCGIYCIIIFNSSYFSSFMAEMQIWMKN
jgi:hypothetical protein